MKEIWFILRMSKVLSCGSSLWNWFWKMNKSDSEGRRKAILSRRKDRQQSKIFPSIRLSVDKSCIKITQLTSKRTCKLGCVSLIFPTQKNKFSYQWKEEDHWRWVENRLSKTTKAQQYFIGWMKALNLVMHVPSSMVFVHNNLTMMETLTWI